MTPEPRRTIPWVAASRDDLLAGAVDRREVRTADAKSGATFERLVVDGRPCFCKTLSGSDDWIMRVTGNTTNWEFRVWRAGLYQRVPDCIDHAILGMALEGAGPDARLSILMADRTADLVPAGDEPIPLRHHRDFLDHLAAFHAGFLGWRDDLGLYALADRFRFFAPDNIAAELTVTDVPIPLAVADRGWRALPGRAPGLAEQVFAVHADPGRLARAFAGTPMAFVAGDWKLGNLGRRPDGRTVLLDWAYPGEAPLCLELAWYLALNAARIPESKESAIGAYRASLERHGIDTGGWWDRQFDLSVLGMAAIIAWEKAVGSEEELAWWSRAAARAERWL
ncbi:hypothetical protein [Microlunatus ginsengisoli]|uniref:Aminoglycoside phosphotransferase n=1 Tax=Microlunatus ginsengisoli TaxID=363863 RepID=A0ABP7ACF0_9ACTN